MNIKVIVLTKDGKEKTVEKAMFPYGPGANPPPTDCIGGPNLHWDYYNFGWEGEKRKWRYMCTAYINTKGEWVEPKEGSLPSNYIKDIESGKLKMTIIKCHC